MPTKTARICSCGRVVQAGERCVCAAARKAASDRDRPSPAARGYDGDHRAARAKHLAAHPYCVECGEVGSVLDHIVSIRKAPHLRLDPKNWQTMCHRCHGKKTARLDGSFGRKAK